MKNQKIIILMIIMVLIIPTINAVLDICRDTIEINTNCTMVSPTMNCTTAVNYSVFNLTGHNVQTGNMTLLAEKVYYFNFTRPKGDYLIRLCDGTTREVIVTDEDGDRMILGLLVLMPFLLGLALLYGSINLHEDHGILKLFTFLLVPITFFSSMHFALITIIKYYDFPELQNLIGSTVYWIGIIFGVIIAYWFIWILIKAINVAAEKKQERWNY